MALVGGPAPVPPQTVAAADAAEFLLAVNESTVQCRCTADVIVIANGSRPYSSLAGCKGKSCRIKTVLGQVNPAAAAGGRTWRVCFDELNEANELCFVNASKLLGVSGDDLNLTYATPMLIHNTLQAKGSWEDRLRVAPRQAGHADYVWGEQVCMNGSQHIINSTELYCGPLPPLGSHRDPNNLAHVKEWLWETLQRPPKEIYNNGRGFSLRPGEFIFFLGPVIHWAPCIRREAPRFMSFRTAAFPHTPEHQEDTQILPWTLAVEYQLFDETMELAKAYTRLGLQPWTTWVPGKSKKMHERMEKEMEPDFTLYQTVVSCGADEQKETEAEGAQGGVKPAKRKRR
jgi:hypothetical protein